LKLTGIPESSATNGESDHAVGTAAPAGDATADAATGGKPAKAAKPGKDAQPA
jgi:hypothetical protein